MEVDFLVTAGMLNFAAALAHMGIIFGGPSWYRFFGAGEAMATLAEQGSIKATLITFSIALVLFLWGVLAWSAAGIVFPSLPFLNYALVLITAIYMVRGIGGLLAPFLTNHHIIKQNSKSFWVVSSLICIAFGIAHLVGLLHKWPSIQ